jgi:hypothetical protein
MPYLIPDLPLGDRSRAAIRERQAEHIRWWWEVLGGDPSQVAVDRRAGSRTCFVPATRTVCFGSDVNPGTGASPNERMSWQAVVAHELRHLQRHEQGVALPRGHLDESLTSLEAATVSTLSAEQQQELLEDALQRVCLLVKSEGLSLTPEQLVIEALRDRLRRLAKELRHGNEGSGTH